MVKTMAILALAFMFCNKAIAGYDVLKPGDKYYLPDGRVLELSRKETILPEGAQLHCPRGDASCLQAGSVRKTYKLHLLDGPQAKHRASGKTVWSLEVGMLAVFYNANHDHLRQAARFIIYDIAAEGNYLYVLYRRAAMIELAKIDVDDKSVATFELCEEGEALGRVARNAAVIPGARVGLADRGPDFVFIYYFGYPTALFQIRAGKAVEIWREER